MNKLNDRDKHIIIGVCVLIVVILIYIIIIFLFTDRREDMTNIESLTYNNCIIEVKENAYRKWDKEKEQATIPLQIVYVIGTKTNFDIQVVNQDNQNLKYTISKEKTKEEGMDSDVFITNYHVQFDMPDDTYYIKLIVTKDGISQCLTLDYRSFKSI